MNSLGVNLPAHPGALLPFRRSAPKETQAARPQEMEVVHRQNSTARSDSRAAALLGHSFLVLFTRDRNFRQLHLAREPVVESLDRRSATVLLKKMGKPLLH